jgi:hypothetical protein
MGFKPNNGIYIYRINKHDEIVSLSDNWLSFAVENDGVDKNSPANVIGKSLWDFISGFDTQFLYQVVLKEVRYSKKSVQLFFRCDSPDTLRYQQLSVIPFEDSGVVFRSELLRTESRETVTLLKSDVERSDTFVSICSGCKKIKVSDMKWEEPDIAINTLKIFEYEPVPQLSHGICKSCFDETMAKIRGKHET